MSKKVEKNIKQGDEVKQLKEELIGRFMVKYKRFPILTYDVTKKIIDEVEKTYPTLDIESQMLIDRKINMYFCKQVTEHDNDEIILLMEEQYKNILSWSLRQLGVPNDKVAGVLDEILLDAIFAYDGLEGFTLFFTHYAREYLANKNKPTLDKILTKMERIKGNPAIPDIVFIGNQSQFIKDIPLDDPTFVRFVAYKFGFLGYYATDEAIMKTLGLDEETFNNYLKKSYQYINIKVQTELDDVTLTPKEKVKTSTK